MYLPTTMLMACRCSIKDATESTLLENSVAIPSSDGKNCGLNPPEKPSAKFPGRRRLNVSGSHEAARK